jgi:hypothetical protein
MDFSMSRILFCVLLIFFNSACQWSESNDSDYDKDGVPNELDVFPNDKNETKDSDKDGKGDNSDKFPHDYDNDGIPDTLDIFPKDKNESLDSDGDGKGDNADIYPYDFDNDSVPDTKDHFPQDASKAFLVTGNVTGLTESIRVHLMGETRTLLNNTAFEFSVKKNTALDFTLDEFPLSQTCLIENAGGIAIKNVNDINIICEDRPLLEHALSSIIDANLSSCLEKTNITYIDEITNITCNHYAITNIAGLEVFTALTQLNLRYNQLEQVDVSGLLDLTMLELSDNNLVKIELGDLAELQYLYLQNNRLGDVTLNGTEKLTTLYLYNNLLTQLNVSALSKLTDLYLFHNKLTSTELGFSEIQDTSANIRLHNNLFDNAAKERLKDMTVNYTNLTY